MYYVYILRCRGGTLYTGVTPDLQRRMAAHAAGTGAKYTRSHPPEELCALWRTAEKGHALSLEWAVKKRLTRAQKLALIAQPERLGEVPGIAAERYEYVANVTLAGLMTDRTDCRAGEGGWQ